MTHRNRSEGEGADAPATQANQAELGSANTRRQFLVRGGATILGSSAGAAVLTRRTAVAGAGGDVRSRAVGTLRVGIVGFPVAWDSAFATNTATYLTRNVLDPLVQLTERLAPKPGLAVSWQSRNGGRIWDFALRPNARWHDGVPFTSRDVVAHFRRILDPKTGSSGKQVYQAVRSVEAQGRGGVRFVLTGPDAEFPLLLGLYQGNIQAAHLDPKTLGKKSMIGTGPFRWGSIVPGQSITLVANDHYFVKGQPGVSKLQFVSFNDEQARKNALLGGAIDVAPDISGDLASQIRTKAGYRLTESLPGGHTAVYLRGDQAPGNDPRVMQALRMTVDRPALVQVALNGYGVATGDNPVVPGSPQYVSVPIPKRDIKAARSLLTAAGFGSSGPELTCYVPGGRPGDGQLALGIQSMAGEAGIKVSISTIPADAFFATYWLKQTFGVDTWGARPTVDAQFRIAYTCSGAWNESHWCDAKFDAMLNQARVEPSATRRTLLYRKLQDYFASHSNVLIPYHFPTLSAHSNAVHNFRETPIVLYTDFRGVTKV
jgi:peptide/nickel transport system substrate-binding protein